MGSVEYGFLGYVFAKMSGSQKLMAGEYPLLCQGKISETSEDVIVQNDI